jgi:predicted RNA-binding protein (virulence factor B family)
MVDSIGIAAGKIWNYLDKNGSSSVSKLTNEAEVSKNEVQRAIGWLLKEDKIVIETIGRVESLSLK